MTMASGQPWMASSKFLTANPSVLECKAFASNNSVTTNMASTYSHLTDEEFLNQMDDRVHKSPILAEFVRRLNSKVENAPGPDTNPRAECPVCQAALTVEYDSGNDLFEVKYDDHS